MKFEKIFIIVAVILLSAGCSKPLQQSQQKIPSSQPDLKPITTNDPDLSSEMISSWGRQKDFFLKNNFIILEWKEAKELLQKKTYRGGKQYHTGWLTIYTHDGAKYLTKQPKIDMFFQFMKEHNLSTQGFAPE